MSQWIDAGPRGSRITVDNTMSLGDDAVLRVKDYEVALRPDQVKWLHVRTGQLLKEAAK